MTAREPQRRGPSPRALLIGLPPAIFLLVLGGYWTIESWGWLGGEPTSGLAASFGPIMAGLGVALGWVVVRGGR